MKNKTIKSFLTFLFLFFALLQTDQAQSKNKSLAEDASVAAKECHAPLTAEEKQERNKLLGLLPIGPIVSEDGAEADDFQAAAYQPLVQPVVFHVLYKKDGTGIVPFTALSKQIDELNKTFSGGEAVTAKYKKATDAKIHFELHAVKYIENDDWHDLCALPSTIAVMRPQVMLDPARYYNVYVCYVGNNLGLSWLPYQSWFNAPLSESHYSLGSSLHYELLPGNTFRRFGGNWSQGDILVHETGHTYGLMHLYEGDCFGGEDNSDNILDTPRQTGNPFSSCSGKGKVDSCKKIAGKDDIQNYMGAYQDACRSHFTPGQVQFMRNVITTYKPTLTRQLPVDCVAAVDSTDQSPDLLPCVDKVQVNPQNSRPWCHTSKTDASLWAWACCPAADGSSNGADNCRVYRPEDVNVLQ
jgi:hypothetical protein